MTERIEGYEVAGRRYVLLEHNGEAAVFVQRAKATMRGRPWLRFMRRIDGIDGQGYWVTAFRTLREART